MTSSFPTWTFDQACQTMEWNSLHPSQLTITSTPPTDSTDLLILGITGTKDDDNENDAPSLEGMALALNTALDGLLVHVMEENSKGFQKGGKVGASTPTVRLVGSSADAAKVRKILLVRFCVVDRNR